jgi:hypothetical protein
MIGAAIDKRPRQAKGKAAIGVRSTRGRLASQLPLADGVQSPCKTFQERKCDDVGHGFYRRLDSVFRDLLGLRRRLRVLLRSRDR